MNLEILDEDGSMGRDILRCLEVCIQGQPLSSTYFEFRVKVKFFYTKWLSQLLTIVNLVTGEEMETVGKKI